MRSGPSISLETLIIRSICPCEILCSHPSNLYRLEININFTRTSRSLIARTNQEIRLIKFKTVRGNLESQKREARYVRLQSVLCVRGLPNDLEDLGRRSGAATCSIK